MKIININKVGLYIHKLLMIEWTFIVCLFYFYSEQRGVLLTKLLVFHKMNITQAQNQACPFSLHSFLSFSFFLFFLFSFSFCGMREGRAFESIRLGDKKTFLLLSHSTTTIEAWVYWQWNKAEVPPQRGTIQTR